ncbi:hypothetical protein [Actinophytocola sediminis]
MTGQPTRCSAGPRRSSVIRDTAIANRAANLAPDRPPAASAIASNARPDVRWASLITGSYDIGIELVVNSGPTRYPKTMLELQQIDGVQRWYSDLLLHVYKVAHDWYKQLLDDRGALPPEVPLCSPEHVDASVELLSLKRGFVETPWWRDQLAEHHADTVTPVGPGAA